MSRDFSIKKLSPTDLAVFKQLLVLFHRVFEMEEELNSSDAYLAKLLSDPSFAVYVALQHEEVVGGLTGFEMRSYYAEHSELYIYDLAVLPQHQRRGIGRRLLAELSSYCRQHNIQNMFVEAHETDGHAVEFYRSSGGQPEKVVHFNYNIR